MGACCVEQFEAFLVAPWSFGCSRRVLIIAVDADGCMGGVTSIGHSVEILLADKRWLAWLALSLVPVEERGRGEEAGPWLIKLARRAKMWLELFGGLEDGNGGGGVCPNKELVVVPDRFCAKGCVGFKGYTGG